MFAKERIPINKWNKTTIMLGKVCAYACNYAHDGIVHQYFCNDQVCYSNHIEMEHQHKN
jgi:hypothetical protein